MRCRVGLKASDTGPVVKLGPYRDVAILYGLRPSVLNSWFPLIYGDQARRPTCRAHFARRKRFIAGWHGEKSGRFAGTEPLTKPRHASYKWSAVTSSAVDLSV